MHLYNRILVSITLIGAGFQLFLYGWNFRWYGWPVSQFSYLTYSYLNLFIFWSALLLLHFTPWIWTRPHFLKRILPHIHKEGRPIQRVLLILFCLEHLIRFCFPFLSALFALFVLVIGTLSLQLQTQKMYWFNVLPVYFFLGVIIGGKPNLNTFQYWRFQYTKLIRSFLKMNEDENHHGETSSQSL